MQFKLGGGQEVLKSENHSTYNGNCHSLNNDELLDLLTQNSNVIQNVENNNIIQISPTPSTSQPKRSPSTPNFDGMTNEQIQDYLISKFQDVELTNNNDAYAMKKQYYQNSKAFPNIPPLTNHFSNSDLASLMSHQIYKDKFNSNDELGNIAQAMSVSHSQNSLNSDSDSSTSKDSSDGSSSEESIPFIMPLSHKCTLQATGDDGKVRIIVPVSPSESTSKVTNEKEGENKGINAGTLKVPVTGNTLAPPATITRTTSEKVPNRSEMMTALRSQWTRHTTK